jgi:amidophosphoribosyltransferase
MIMKTHSCIRQSARGIGEECGVFGIYSFAKRDVRFRIYNGLVVIQHRGQDSAGIAIYNGKRIRVKTGAGLVSDIFTKEAMEKLDGYVGIGHVRYPTIGADVRVDAQPVFANFLKKGIALAHNGNIINYGPLRRETEEKGRSFNGRCDAEVVLNVFADEYLKRKDLFEAAKGSMKRLEGSYSVVLMTGEGELVAFRDPYGVKPLCFGKTKDMVVFSSESVALDVNEIKLGGDVLPGEVWVISKKGIKRKVVMKGKRKAHCMFEYVYFSRPDSVLDKKLVYDVRVELGKRLARAAPAKADIVVPVPDTSRPAAEGYSTESGIPIAEGLIKNRYVARTFIMPTQEKRANSVKLKLNTIKPVVNGKRIILIDDSIVRGTTIGPIVKLLKNSGAKEVHVRITSPPIQAPCFYGIDMPTYSELIAYNQSVEEIRKKTGADSLAYQRIEDLIGAIGIKKDGLCLGCLNEDYPTEAGKKMAERIKKGKTKEGMRAWEE